MTIKGPRLELRGVEFNHLQERCRWLNDPDVTCFFTNAGVFPVTIKQMENWYGKITQDTGEIHFSIFTSDSKHIGGAQLKSIDWRNRSSEFGIFIGEKNEWGKGYCREATQLLMNYGFNTLNLHRIWLRVDVENERAIGCYEERGFYKEGVFREEVFRDGTYHDSMVMSILSREFRKGKAIPSEEP